MKLNTFKIWFCAALVGTAAMVYFNPSKAAPNSVEFCNWGKWAYSQGIKLKDLVDTLNSVEAMPYDDKMIVVRCFVESMETI